MLDGSYWVRNNKHSVAISESIESTNAEDIFVDNTIVDYNFDTIDQTLSNKIDRSDWDSGVLIEDI